MLVIKSVTTPFSKAYMRRIIRGEITTSQVPQALQAEVEDLISQRALTLLNASVSNGLINGVASIERSFERGISLTFIITANEGYRVPTQDEIWSKAHLSATNDSGQTIPHYAEAHTSWYSTENQATANVVLSQDCKTIETSVECIALDTKPKKKAKKK